MTKGIFITATGTDVGKTYISALIVKKMKDLGYDCGYYKPALSGTVNGIPGDCEYVLNTAGINKNPMDCVSYAFEPAVSPHLAAKIENSPIKIEKILTDFKNIKNDYILVEGAGGIVCPFNLDQDNEILLPDVIKALKTNIVIVADAKLGTINSTILTVEYARQKGLKTKGIILNNYDENDFMQADNKKQIEALTKIKVIATVKKNDKNIKIDNIENIFEEI